MATPEIFGPYVIKEKLASGGMADLYLAETEQPDGTTRGVALKMLHQRLETDPRYVSLFFDEATLVSRLVHENVVAVYDFGELEGRPYMTMEYVDGMDLESLMGQCSVMGVPVPAELLIRIGADVARGLHFAHRATNDDGDALGIVHRDVSPNNILISSAGAVKVCDFGIASSSETADGQDGEEIKGKLHYLSPEQVRNQPVDARSDVFSLGVTLYEMLAGHHPVQDDSALAVLRTLQEGTSYPPLEEFAPWLSAGLTAAADKATAFDPAERFQTAEAFAVALEKVLDADFGTVDGGILAGLVEAARTEAAQERKRIADAFPNAARTAAQRQGKQGKQTDGAGGVSRGRLWALLSIVILIFLLGGGLLFQFGFGTSEAPVQNQKPTIPEPSTPVAPVVSVLERDTDEERSTDDGGEVDSDSNPVQGEGLSERPHRSTPVVRKKGTAQLNASPWAHVSIDGKPYGNTPILGLKLPVGRHRVVFSNPDFDQQIKRTIMIKYEETVRVIVDFPE